MAKQAVILSNGLTRRQYRAVQKTLQEIERAQSFKGEADNDLPFKTPGFSGGFWTFGGVRPFHRATGWQIASANPFAASDLYDPAGPVIGVNKDSGGLFTFDPWELYLRGLVSSPNVLIQGSLRQGKSYFIKRLVSLLSVFGRYAINTSDSKGEHGELAKVLGGDVFKMGVYGSEIRLNPLEAGEAREGESAAQYEARVKGARTVILQQLAELLHPGARSVTSREVAIIDWVLDEACKLGGVPTVRDVWRLLDDRRLFTASNVHFDFNDASDLRDGYRRLVYGDLSGMFDYHSTVKLNPVSPYTVIDTFNISQRGSQALAVTQAVTNAWVQATISNKDSGRRYFLIREEGWRDMKTVGALEAHQEQLKLSGEYGIAMVLIVHEDGDFDSVGPEGSKERELAKSLLRGYANKVCFYQPEATLRNAVRTGSFSQTEADAISVMRRGQCLVKMRDRSYVVDLNPTSTGFERELFDTDRQMRKRIDAASENEV